VKLWLSKPVYTLLPYFYMLAGIACLGAGVYLKYWYWPLICVLVGLACLAFGVTIWLRRRQARRSRAVPTDL
jgi:uncharacterized membrane protein